MISLPRTLLIFALSLVVPWLAVADTPRDWPAWRGPQQNGSSAGGPFPTTWNAEDVLWKTPLPGKGCSTPIVFQQQIILTAPLDGRDAVLAFDLSGKRLWERTFGPERGGKHRNGSGCNPSPATDGQSVFVYFKSGTMAAVDLQGRVRWSTNLVERYGPETLFWDQGTSPVLTRDLVVLARMHHGESWLAAFDQGTGDLRWKVARNYETPTEGDHGYTTPLVIQHHGQEALLVWGGQHLTAHDTRDGSVLWTCGGFNPDGEALWPAIATPVIAGEMVIVAFGRNDRGKPTLHGIRLGGEGDVTASHRVWKRTDTGTFVPSPAEYQGRVFLLRDRGEVECLDPRTGATIWSGAFPRHRAAFYASPLIVGDQLFAAREDGVVFVARIQDNFQQLAANDMREPVIASPVPGPQRLFIRGEDHLFCVGAAP